MDPVGCLLHDHPQTSSSPHFFLHLMERQELLTKHSGRFLSPGILGQSYFKPYLLIKKSPNCSRITNLNCPIWFWAILSLKYFWGDFFLGAFPFLNHHPFGWGIPNWRLWSLQLWPARNHPNHATAPPFSSKSPQANWHRGLAWLRTHWEWS